MKLLPVLLLNVVTAAAAVFIYDQVRGDTPAAEPAASANEVDLSGIEARLSALEAKPGPALRAEGPRAVTPADLAALEKRLAALEKPAPVAPTSTGPMATVDAGTEPTLKTGGGEITEDDVKRFKKLAAKAGAQERAKRLKKFVGKALGRAGIKLSDDEQTKLAEVVHNWRERRDEVWGQVKREVSNQGGTPDWERIIEDTNTQLEQELTEAITEALPNSDADALADAVTGGGGK